MDERPDVISRLKAIMEHAATDRMVRYQIEEAFRWYESLPVAADTTQPPALAEAEPQSPAPTDETSEQPRR